MVDGRADRLVEERAGPAESQNRAYLLNQLRPGEAESRVKHREDRFSVLLRRDPVRRDASAAPGAEPAFALRAPEEFAAAPEGSATLRRVASLLDAGLDAGARPAAAK